jgi:tetratricopeptide (TPR) repeat protein
MNGMEKKIKMIELLGKKNLTPEEKKTLRSLIQDKELKEIHDLYITTSQTLTHISTDELSDYILVRNNLDPVDNVIHSKINRIEDHLRECTRCTDEFRMLNQELSDIEVHVSEKLENRRDSSVFTPAITGKFFRSGILVSTIIVLGFLYLVVFSLSEFTTPDSYKYARDFDENYYVTRGRATDEFQRSTLALENRNYPEAIKYLQNDIRKNENDETIFYSHYILGITFLKASEKDLAGLFPSYDASMVKEGINNLEKSIEMNNSGRYNNIIYESYYHLGRGSLMLNDKISARKYFTLVVGNKGSRMEKADEILKGLSN